MGLGVLFPVACLLGETLPLELCADLWAGKNGGLVLPEWHDKGIYHQIVRKRDSSGRFLGRRLTRAHPKIGREFSVLLCGNALTRHSFALGILTAGSASHCCESNLCARHECELANDRRRCHSGAEKTSGHVIGFCERLSRSMEILDRVRSNLALLVVFRGGELTVGGRSLRAGRLRKTFWNTGWPVLQQSQVPSA